jgi:hypothetical protein
MVVVSIDLRARFNPGQGSAGLLPKPADVDRWLSQSILYAPGSVTPGHITKSKSKSIHSATNGGGNGGFSRANAGLRNIDRSSFLCGHNYPGINFLLDS